METGSDHVPVGRKARHWALPVVGPCLHEKKHSVLLWLIYKRQGCSSVAEMRTAPWEEVLRRKALLSNVLWGKEEQDGGCNKSQ